MITKCYASGQNPHEKTGRRHLESVQGTCLASGRCLPGQTGFPQGHGQSPLCFPHFPCLPVAISTRYRSSAEGLERPRPGPGFTSTRLKNGQAGLRRVCTAQQRESPRPPTAISHKQIPKSRSLPIPLPHCPPCAVSLGMSAFSSLWLHLASWPAWSSSRNWPAE